MKYLKIYLSVFALVLMGFSVNAQGCKASCCAKKETKADNSSSAVETETSSALVETTKKITTATFMVYGNCGMCKSRIENALKDEKGVEAASWDSDTKMLTVSFKSKNISLDDIHKKVAAVGHDTEKVRAEDEVYNNLHGCCQYERTKV